MGQLKDLLVAGPSRLIGKLFTNEVQLTTLNIPTTSGGTTYGPGNNNQLLKSNGSSVYWTTLTADDIPNLNASKINAGILPVARGGTNASSFTQWGVVYASSSSQLTNTGAGTAGQILKSNGSSAPTWVDQSSISVGIATKLATARTIQTKLDSTSAASFDGSANITPGVTGILAVGNGGTGRDTLTSGAALIGNGTSQVALRSITNNTSATAVTASTNLITANTLYYHTGNSNIVTVGTISSGTWQGTTVGVGYGGTGKTSWTAGGVIYASATNTLTDSGLGTSGQFLKSGGTSVSWASLSADDIPNIGAGKITSGTLPIARGGTGVSSFTTNTMIWCNAATTLASSTLTTDGSYLGAVSYLSINTDHQTSYRLYVNGASYLNGAVTATGIITAKANSYNDAYDGALNMNNSDIYGLNSIYTADASDNAAEGIHFYRSATNVDSLWVSGGNIYFVPNRALGTATTAANSQKVLRGPTSITDNYLFKADGTTGLTKQIQASTATVANTIVQRDASGNFSAGTITASLSGNASTATKATQDGSGNTITSTYVKKAGDTMTGALTIKGLKGTTEVDYGETLPASGTEGQIFYQLSEEVYELPSGGAAGAFLMKNSAADYDVKWGTVAGVQGIPSGGTAGSLLMKNSATNYDVAWTPSSIHVSGGVLYGAAWNDYAEYRKTQTKIEPGRVIVENGDDTLRLSEKRLEAGAEIVSDTFGFAIGQTKTSQTPVAASGRVLAYPNEPRETYKPGQPVCSGPNGTVSMMTDQEARDFPWLIIGTVSAIPDYEIWGEDNIKVNGRIWIRIR